jgi:hypothetical protein
VIILVFCNVSSLCHLLRTLCVCVCVCVCGFFWVIRWCVGDQFFLVL